jgi:hypothetical protein
VSGLQIICGICGNRSNVWPQSPEEFRLLVPEGWHLVPFPKELIDAAALNDDPDPYRVCSLRCLHLLEQKLEHLKRS